MEETRPPLWNSKSIATVTKVIAIYAAFYLCVVIVQIFTNPLWDNPLAPSNAYYPLYLMAAIHLIVLILTGASVLFKNYHWVVTVIAVLIVTLSRFYYNEIAEYIWNISATPFY
ncbi:hypothetical protein [uncultured Nonlabens sp.]|uniref:hypothetical protein n=1 Tax=uncultured Nonlabens sp. TaxID=859306 RepID=UPI0026370D2A|nr:hypothetical protein [uncultured Nonlabens sp.]